MTDDDHISLLSAIRALPFRILISTYKSDLYAEMLKDWNRTRFTSQTRKGKATEYLYYNFEPPVKLHDYRFLGRNFREREKYARRARNLTAKILSLSEIERNAVIAHVLNLTK